MGPKFALPYRNLAQMPFVHLIADVEVVLSTQTDRDIRERTRCQIINEVQSFIRRSSSGSPTPVERFCHRAESATRRFIKTHPDVLITEADKGSRTVIMNLQQYDTKMKLLVEDTDTYEPLNRDPTAGYQRRNNNIVDRLYQLKLIDGKTKYHLKSSNAICPRIYGLPKAHKEGMPLRPVVPNVTAPTYNLCRYVSRILQASTNSVYDAKDSKTFCEYANQLQVPQDHILVSFDAVSLFTNVTKRVVVHDIIMMWDKIKVNTEINLDLFLEILEFCIDASFFVFRGKFFHQRSGTAMGSPLSPVLADIVMDNIITRVALAANIPVNHIRKYVDDLFVLIHKDKVQEVLDVFNLQDDHIRFTCEVEENGKLPYLDLLLIRTDDGRIKTDWYAKPISSGRMLNYFSFHPMEQKLGVVSNFIDRVRTLSTVRTEDEKNQLITGLLTRNNYPRQLINRLLHQARPTENVNKPSCYRSMVHVPGLTPSIKRILRTNMPEVGIASSVEHTVKSLCTTAKDPVPHMQKSNVVYKIACQDCQDCYIGMTKNQLKTRMYGHQSLINSLERELSTGHEYMDPVVQQLSEKTALMEHCIAHQHRFDLQNPSIVDTSFKTAALPVLEMCHIYTTPHTVNRRTDTDGISATYSYLLTTIGSLRAVRSQGPRRSYGDPVEPDDTTTTQDI